MAATVSTRWFFADWLSDPALRACSYAARGLWKDMLCIAAANKRRQHGMLMLNGRALTIDEIARITNGAEAEVAELVAELEHNGVFSRNRVGIIYCRRMVRAQKSRENGKLGGNPNLLNGQQNKKQVNRRPNPHLPEPEPEPEPYPKKERYREADADRTRAKKRAHAPDQKDKGHPRQEVRKGAPRSPMPETWAPTEAGRQYATELGISASRIPLLSRRCRNYHIRKGTMIAGERGLAATWRMWCDKEIEFAGDAQKNGADVWENFVPYSVATKGMTEEQKKAYVQEEIRKDKEAHRVG